MHELSLHPPRRLAQLLSLLSLLTGCGVSHEPLTSSDHRVDLAFDQTDDGLQVAYRAEATVNGTPISLVVRQSTAAGNTLPGAVANLEIVHGGESVFTVEYTFDEAQTQGQPPPGFTVRYAYGDAVAGPRAIHLRVDGDTVTGTVDGQVLRAFAVGSNAPLLLADGTVAPVPTPDADLEAALRELDRVVKTEVASAAPTAIGGDVPCQPSAVDSLRGPEMVLFASPGGGSQNTPYSGTNGQQCIGCEKGCVNAWATCIATAGVIGFFCPPCGVGAAIGCITAYLGCEGLCFVPGNACCGTFCSVLSCCDQNESCCGDVCCDSSQVCAADGQCCPSDLPLACGSGCCLAGTDCCGGSCCPLGEVCIDDEPTTCCPAAQACGDDCCDPGDSCHVTSAGTSICCAHELCGDECCAPGAVCNNGHCGFGAPCGDLFCGIANPVCCGDVCCASNETCIAGACTPPQCGFGELACPLTPELCCPDGDQCCPQDPAGCCDAPDFECCGTTSSCVPTGTCPAIP